MSLDLDAVIDGNVAAELLGVSRPTLDGWRSKNRPCPRAVKYGHGLVRYIVRDVLAFRDSYRESTRNQGK
jgi:predicted DNA-binding transcriptional regulator AlpA